MPMPSTRNQRDHDLLLAAKGHYGSAASTVEGARRVVAFHNMHVFGSISDADVAHCVLHDLMPHLWSQLTADRMSAMLLELGPRPVLGGHIDNEGGVY